MDKFEGYKIAGTIELIKNTQAMIDNHKSYDDNDPASAFMILQYEHIKRNLFKEILAELALSGVSFKNIAPIIMQMTNYLEELDEDRVLPVELKSHLEFVEKLLSVPAYK